MKIYEVLQALNELGPETGRYRDPKTGRYGKRPTSTSALDQVAAKGVNPDLTQQMRDKLAQRQAQQAKTKPLSPDEIAKKKAELKGRRQAGTSQAGVKTGFKGLGQQQPAADQPTAATGDQQSTGQATGSGAQQQAATDNSQQSAPTGNQQTQAQPNQPGTTADQNNQTANQQPQDQAQPAAQPSKWDKVKQAGKYIPKIAGGALGVAGGALGAIGGAYNSFAKGFNTGSRAVGGKSSFSMPTAQTGSGKDYFDTSGSGNSGDAAAIRKAIQNIDQRLKKANL